MSQPSRKHHNRLKVQQKLGEQIFKKILAHLLKNQQRTASLPNPARARVFDSVLTRDKDLDAENAKDLKFVFMIKRDHVARTARVPRFVFMAA